MFISANVIETRLSSELFLVKKKKKNWQKHVCNGTNFRSFPQSMVELEKCLD